MVDTSLVLATTAIMISIAAIIPSYYNLFTRRAEKRLKFELERVTFASNMPIPSDWTVGILRPSATIEHCSVIVQFPGKNDSKKPLFVVLPVADRQNMYEIKIPKESCMNFRVPMGIVPESRVIFVKDGNKVLLKRNAKDVPLTNP